MSGSLGGTQVIDNMMVISGPSGSGKSTLIDLLLKGNPETYFAVSHTTRPQRRGERNGKEYYFISESEFLEMKEDNRFVEWALVHSHYYGTSIQEIEAGSQKGGMLILDLDVQGARNLKKIYPHAGYVLIIPPSLEELKKRLYLRQDGHDDSAIKRRLSIATEELSQYRLYDFVVVNKELERAYTELQCIYVALTHRISSYRQLIEKILSGVR